MESRITPLNRPHKIPSAPLFLAAILATTALLFATAEAAKAGLLMTQGSQYPAMLGSASTESEFPNANNFASTEGGGYFVSCSTLTMTGTLGWARTTPALHPAFSGCKSSAGFGATITTTGCNFRLHLGATIGETGRYDGTASIECEAGKAITITSETCETKIDPQAARSTIELGNVAGSPGHVSIKWSLKSIAYTVLKDSFGCQLNGIGTTSTGDFVSTATLTAKTAGGTPVGLTVEDGGRSPTEEEHLEAHHAATAHQSTTAHETKTAEEAKTAHEAETAAETSGGRLMTEGGQYPATLHSANQSESPPASQFVPTDGGDFFVNCSTSTMTGTLGWARTTPLLHPEFFGCRSVTTGFGATITTTGCDFRLHIGSTIGLTGRYDGTASIECETGKAITIVGDACEIKIDSQATRSTIELSNVAGSPGHVHVNWSLKGIVYTVLKDPPFGCRLNGIGTKETGDFSSSATLLAKDGNGKAVGLTVEDP
jgi:hypothetical protein